MPPPGRRNPPHQKRTATTKEPAIPDSTAAPNVPVRLRNKQEQPPDTQKRQHEASDSEDTHSRKKVKAPNASPASSNPTTKSNAKPVPLPRAPLPSRARRNEHPGNVDKPRPKRTAMEVAAANAEKEEKKRKLEELEREKKRILAEMLLDEEDADEEQKAKSIRRLSDISDAVIGDDCEGRSSASDESFMAEDGPDSDVSEPPIRVLKTRKKGKSDLRVEVNAMKEDIRGNRKKNKGVDNDASSNVATVNLKAGRKQVPASGLVNDWRKVTTLAAKRGPRKESDLVLGGLNDADASAKKPKSKPMKPAKGTFNPSMSRDHTRQNEMVVAISESDTSDFEGSTPSKPTKLVTKSSAPSQSAQASKKPKKSSSVSKESDTQSVPVTRIAGLPEFAKVGWTSRFLPTLYDALYADENPFDNFVKDSPEFLKLVKKVFSDVYPRSNFKVHKGDIIHKAANDRTNEKKSKIAIMAIANIDKHLLKVGLAGNLDEIRRWCVYAKRPDGPLFWKIPTPQDCTVDDRHPDYIKPKGFMQSDFVMDIARAFLKHRKASVGSYGHPKGLLSIIGAALERAIRAYVKGIRMNPPPFSAENDGARVQGYMDNFLKFREHHWQDLLSACGPGSETQFEPDFGDISLLEQNRGNLFMPSSPMKED